ncbi:hypothetical protein Q8791_07675 [Nocardiopsis sp. CT-R113]|uniref:Uncharacterized protein n=1 Tax=Nocardiopsis codii TaxID=3065942 RepID=A0ABU7K4C7_9ACTN|nr:hypothetical protein [Nocardiopsis sp. CT-R113]MEE2037097.1 hypothetical protein [Nocardiopsis sp. CT-R113]
MSEHRLGSEDPGQTTVGGGLAQQPPRGGGHQRAPRAEHHRPGEQSPPQ